MEEKSGKHGDKMHARRVFKHSHIPLSGECQPQWLKKEQNMATYLKCLEVDYRKLLMENCEIRKFMEANEKIFLKTKAELYKTNLELEKVKLFKENLTAEMSEKESSWNRDKYKLLKEREAMLNEMSQMVEDIKHLALKYMELVVRTLEDENRLKQKEEGKGKEKKGKKDCSLFGRMINRFIPKTSL
ncbi:chromosome partition protein Smc-like [Syngnathoides biaculeatus]|uniref:chromosome partition protein Smc-like n=1 Tax=Syngnathoides biaculeatus TaxID=300417 RepID=UPI002ADE04C2|nr:chromosome partition protein Smc-like [Syngnathoides biaculeatus]